MQLVDPVVFCVDVDNSHPWLGVVGDKEEVLFFLYHHRGGWYRLIRVQGSERGMMRNFNNLITGFGLDVYHKLGR